MSPCTTTTSAGASPAVSAPNVLATRHSPPPKTWSRIVASGGQEASARVASASKAAIASTAVAARNPALGCAFEFMEFPCTGVNYAPRRQIKLHQQAEAHGRAHRGRLRGSRHLEQRGRAACLGHREQG